MSKQKLAELVMQKMLQKKQEEQRNRPHREVLQLLVKFEIEDYRHLNQEIKELENSLQNQTAIMEELNSCLMDLQNTGKKNYPRIIINPDFIASENIKAPVKEYYRKAANTFLREDILKRRQFELDHQKMENIKQLFAKIKEKQVKIIDVAEKDRVTTNNKRVRNLKQDLRLRSIREQQKQIQSTIDEERDQHAQLLKQYQIKKTNLQNRIDWSEKLTVLIQNQKKLIEKVYNPVAYRDYLKTIFGIRTKNEYMQKNLFQVVKRVDEIESKTVNKERMLESKYNFFVQGKCSNSPSKKKGSQSKNYSSTSSPRKRGQSQMKVSTKPQRLVTQKLNTPKTSKKQNKSFGSLGKTTASSMSNLLKDSNSKKRSFSVSAQLNGNKKITMKA